MVYANNSKENKARAALNKFVDIRNAMRGDLFIAFSTSYQANHAVLFYE